VILIDEDVLCWLKEEEVGMVIHSCRFHEDVAFRFFFLCCFCFVISKRIVFCSVLLFLTSEDLC